MRRSLPRARTAPSLLVHRSRSDWLWFSSFRSEHLLYSQPWPLSSGERERFCDGNECETDSSFALSAFIGISQTGSLSVLRCEVHCRAQREACQRSFGLRVSAETVKCGKRTKDNQRVVITELHLMMATKSIGYNSRGHTGREGLFDLGAVEFTAEIRVCEISSRFEAASDSRSSHR